MELNQTLTMIMIIFSSRPCRVGSVTNKIVIMMAAVVD